MRPKIKNVAGFKDSIYNISLDCTKDSEHETYGRGIFVGLASGLMAVTGCSLDEALRTISEYRTDEVNPHCIPASWEKLAKHAGII